MKIFFGRPPPANEDAVTEEAGRDTKRRKPVENALVTDYSYIYKSWMDAPERQCAVAMTVVRTPKVYDWARKQRSLRSTREINDLYQQKYAIRVPLDSPVRALVNLPSFRSLPVRLDSGLYGSAHRKTWPVIRRINRTSLYPAPTTERLEYFNLDGRTLFVGLLFSL